MKELVKGSDGGHQRHELEHCDAVGTTRQCALRGEARRRDRGSSPAAPGHRRVALLWLHSWRRTG
eukprot:1469360-Pleurochrysis_carterae.AAC.1